MEILVLVLIAFVAVAVGRLWSTATQESAAVPPTAETVPPYYDASHGTDSDGSGSD
jgi:hypothetical protein